MKKMVEKILGPGIICLLVLALWHSPCQAVTVGFDFFGQTPQFDTGDQGAPLHLFIHDYAMPYAGTVTSVTFRNDSDTTSGLQPISLLILHPNAGGWNVAHRVDLQDAIFNHGAPGDTTYMLPTALPVEQGDIFGHWQEQGPGPIPLNIYGTGLSNGQYGFYSSDIDPGDFILNAGFTGGRDYFINLNLTPVPEPCTMLLLGFGLFGFAGLRRQFKR
jgi:hypothetical protein